MSDRVIQFVKKASELDGLIRTNSYLFFPQKKKKERKKKFFYSNLFKTLAMYSSKYLRKIWPLK